jgi:hypothetical protein
MDLRDEVKHLALVVAEARALRPMEMEVTAAVSGEDQEPGLESAEGRVGRGRVVGATEALPHAVE